MRYIDDWDFYKHRWEFTETVITPHKPIIIPYTMLYERSPLSDYGYLETIDDTIERALPIESDEPMSGSYAIDWRKSGERRYQRIRYYDFDFLFDVRNPSDWQQGERLQKGAFEQRRIIDNNFEMIASLLMAEEFGALSIPAKDLIRDLPDSVSYASKVIEIDKGKIFITFVSTMEKHINEDILNDIQTALESKPGFPGSLW